MGAPQARKFWYFDHLKRRFARGKRCFRCLFLAPKSQRGEAQGGAKITQDLKLQFVPPLFKKPKWVIGGGQTSGTPLIDTRAVQKKTDPTELDRKPYTVFLYQKLLDWGDNSKFMDSIAFLNEQKNLPLLQK